jgi:DNA-binding HxlR family transcriptional regulator
MRTYGDPCGIARALDQVGERWALLIVRELLLGPKRFTDLRAALPGVSPDVLSQRLRELEQTGLVRRDTLPPPAAARIYELTERGRGLEPVLIELGRWGSRVPFPVSDRELGVDAFVLALKTLAQPGPPAATYGLTVAGQPFRATVAAEGFEISRGAAEHPDATIKGNPSALARVLWHGEAVASAQSAGELTVDGDAGAVERFFGGLFPAPLSESDNRKSAPKDESEPNFRK